MNLVTFLLITAIVGAIVAAFVQGTARTISLITALLAFVLLVGTPGSQGTSNFFSNLFGGNRTDTATTQTFDTTTGVTTTGTTGATGTTGVGGGTGTTAQGGTGTAQQTGQPTTPGNLPASPLPGITGDNGRSGTTPARSFTTTNGGTTTGGTAATRSTSRTFPSGFTTENTQTRRFRALW
ncbi:hypothetical protein H6F67_25465 [Microcoleus sp. FACHB-1515]|uniref:hypothetical protein n=1 Tax=Cyanophyceae TaxID=3028117 RepID=UPI001684AA41|nr:hypothetical protein [Microcoleus sp. FACHB-1515]MBD2093196.1 hypothetical protein [Microcoleus sp. FACHB-1515]